MLTRVAAADAALPSVEEVVAFWKLNGLKPSTTIIYQRWVHRFISDCTHRGISPAAHLTAAEVGRFATREARRCQINHEEAKRMARMSLHVWSMSLATIGVQLPVWSEPKTVSRPVPQVLTEYTDYRRAHSNAKDVSIKHETQYIASWLRFLHSRHRKLRAIRLSDVDAFLVRLRRQYSVSTVSGRMSSLRLFCRFLHSTGRLQHDLASSIQCPPRRRVQPPRALPWSDVQRILRAIDRKTRAGLRDYAMFLLMSLYGLGSAEVIGLKLEDVHWPANTLTVRRPKTGVEIQLPLLPAAARALAAYLRKARPPDAPTRSFFVRCQMPHGPFTSSAIRFAIRSYAAKAGMPKQVLGGHVLRHSHASRQVDQHAPPRVLSSILGHLDPESTSAYTRVAVERLRGIALPVPR
jgi:site-specific recombinase XerD